MEKQNNFLSNFSDLLKYFLILALQALLNKTLLKMLIILVGYNNLRCFIRSENQRFSCGAYK
ncbi:hypothetical protein ACPSKX_16165 [Moritella viscosa]